MKDNIKVGPIKQMLMCYRVCDLDNPHPSSVQSVCSQCKESVWIKPENLVLQMTRICHHCASKLKASEVIILPAVMAHKHQAERN